MRALALRRRVRSALAVPSQRHHHKRFRAHSNSHGQRWEFCCCFAASSSCIPIGLGTTSTNTSTTIRIRRGYSTRSRTVVRSRIDDARRMDRERLYEYLQLQTFSNEELTNVFQRIQTYPRNANLIDDRTSTHTDTTSTGSCIDQSQIAAFLFDRLQEIDKQIHKDTQPSSSVHNITIDNNNKNNDDNNNTQKQLRQYADNESQRFLQVFTQHPYSHNEKNDTSTVSQDQFVDTITEMATAVDIKRMWPITVSILLVGTSVGIVTPAMPFVVEALQLTPGQYGTVVSAFALAKMSGNIPSAILVERHGRKPYLTYSLAVIALGVGGIGAATTFEQLYLCRLLTGAGVAALTTASQLMVTDVSTPLNRATTMSPIVSAFAAGTALGPALGGTLVDQVGLQTTFYMVGTSYLGVALLNRIILQETKPPKQPLLHLFHDLPGIPSKIEQQQQPATKQPRKGDHQKPTGQSSISTNENDNDSNDPTMASAVKDALAQWVPLMQNHQIRSIMIMNGFYWFALAGSQMTLLPLLLTSPAPLGLEMTASGVGQVYMSMSVVQVLSNPFMARYLVDRIGKAPAISGGCTVISISMMSLPLWTSPPDNWPFFVGTLGFWALGSSMLSTAPLAYISDQVDEDKRAQAIAMLRTSGDIGFLMGASCIGGLADVLGGSLDLAMQSSGGLLSAATVWFMIRQNLLFDGGNSTTAGTDTYQQQRGSSSRSTTWTNNDENEATANNRRQDKKQE